MTVWCAAVGTLSPVSSPSAPGEVCPGALKLGGALESSDVAGASRQDGGSYRWTSSMQSSSTLPPGGVSWWSLPASECSKLPPEGWSLPSLGAVGAGGATGDHGWQLSRGGATCDCDAGTLLFGALVAVVFWQIIRWW